MKTTRLPLLPVLFLVLLLGGCTTPYHPPVVVRDSTPFPGIAGIAAANGARPVDLILVHGMCTPAPGWAERSIARIAGAVADQVPAASVAPATGDGGIQLVERTQQVGGGTVRFHALLWSGLTAPLKRQLDDDHSAEPTDCAADQVCKPVRALLNATVKDKLLNDCLADAVIYEGASHGAIRDAMVETISRIVAASPDADATLVVVAESLGSKMLFDALSSMLESNQPRTQALGQLAARRLGLIYMAGNQLPILGLAEQSIVARAMPVQDALQRFLELRRRQPGQQRAERLQRLAVVAFTDPNDLLSYRLLPARYAAPDVAVADVLVSNDRTWLGLFENPVTAHLDYLANPGVTALVACGWPRASPCR
jgi:hypothetical protein